MRASLERIGRFDEARARARFLSSFEPASTRHIEANGERIGFVVVTVHPDHLSLDHFYVQPASQNLGAGAAVLDCLFTEADHAGMDIRVGALKQSDSNRFYARHGFEFDRAEKFDNYYVRRAKPSRPPQTIEPAQ
jgi:ribosomal protein S18 acetylase RimI-like enzyme